MSDAELWEERLKKEEVKQQIKEKMIEAITKLLSKNDRNLYSYWIYFDVKGNVHLEQTKQMEAEDFRDNKNEKIYVITHFNTTDRFLKDFLKKPDFWLEHIIEVAMNEIQRKIAWEEYFRKQKEKQSVI
jgi:hypothetical protein